MAKKVFISYRRWDSIDVVGRIDDHLVAVFGRRNVFKDVDSVRLGVDFREEITKAVGRCDVLLAVIGPKWAGEADDDSSTRTISLTGPAPPPEAGGRRIDETGDYVRLEIEAALRRGIPVIPILVGTTPMPSAEQLPESLEELAYRSGTRVRPDPDFRGDVDRVVRAIRVAGSPRPAPWGGVAAVFHGLLAWSPATMTRAVLSRIRLAWTPWPWIRQEWRQWSRPSRAPLPPLVPTWLWVTALALIAVLVLVSFREHR